MFPYKNHIRKRCNLSNRDNAKTFLVGCRTGHSSRLTGYFFTSFNSDSRRCVQITPNSNMQDYDPL
uniref:Ovule protein n=1 Tax=Ascaris lumbricoides TaxID=6252 RepID=A0A0M3IJZ5_ASCLU